MALSPELETFIGNWRKKAEAYSTADLSGAFDRFFTLYVVFNRLYAEATFRLARRGRVNLRDRFPDSKAAEDYVLQFCGAQALTEAWECDPNAANSVRVIADHLRNGIFALKLDLVTGAPRPESDREILAGLESTNRQRRARAVLKALYAIRCNMFHGHKGFNPIQLELLRPAICLLENTIDILKQRLSRNDG